MNLSDDDQNVLNIELPEDYTPPDTPFPWRAIILGAIGLAIVLLAVIILWVVIRNHSKQTAVQPGTPAVIQGTATQRASKSPERVVEDFYLAVSQGDRTQAAQFMDPRKPGLDPRVTLLDTVQKLVGSILPGDVKLVFRNPTYKMVSQQGDQAQVRVVAELVIVAPDSAFDQMIVPWSYTHKMILIEGQWYIVF